MANLKYKNTILSFYFKVYVLINLNTMMTFGGILWT